MQTIETTVEFSQDQADAWLDSCLYGMPYGIIVGEREYIAKELAKRNLQLVTHLDLDNDKLTHKVTAKEL